LRLLPAEDVDQVFTFFERLGREELEDVDATADCHG
jgi:hypothetical protein